MSVVLTWLRLELRHRWRSLLVLVVLIALATGTVLTAVAGARRGASAIDRLREVTLPATAVVLPNQPGFDWAAVRALPQVEALSTFPITYYSIEGIPDENHAAWYPPADDESMRTLERPVVLDGRLADPRRADEVVVTPAFVDSYGRRVGDTVTLRLHTPEGVDTAESTGTPPLPEGPRVTATIVGVVRSMWFADVELFTKGRLILSPGLVAQYRANLFGGGEVIFANAFVRLRGGEADLPTFRAGLAELTGRTDIDMLLGAENARNLRRLHSFESACLLAFGLAALLAAMVLVGQSIARYAAATVTDLRMLRGVGLTPYQGVLVAAAAPLLAGLAGTAIGVAGAVVSSQWMPFGGAAALEPAPGPHADWLVLGAGAALFLALVLLGAGAAAWAAFASGRAKTSPRRSAVARAAARTGLPVAAVVGSRFALEPGQGRSAVPVRPALFGAATGVLGVLAAFTFSAGVADAADNPARFGLTYQLRVAFGFNDQSLLPSKPVLSALAQDPDIAGLGDARSAVAATQDTSFSVFTHDPVGAPVPMVLTAGRAPETEAEVVLGPDTARRIDATLGSSIELVGTKGTVRVTVTGLGFVPELYHNTYAEGGWLTPGAYGTLFDGFKNHIGLIALRPGVDPTTVLPRLQRVAGAAVGQPEVPLIMVPSPSRAGEVQNVRILPVVLGGFLGLLAVGAIGHALATAVRQRRHDIAVLRALGMTRWQARGVIVTQASVLAGIGLLFGVPLGLALGRTLWRVVADSTPLQYVPPVAVAALVLIVPLALLVANLLAAPAGHRAARLPVNQILRAE